MSQDDGHIHKLMMDYQSAVLKVNGFAAKTNAASELKEIKNAAARLRKLMAKRDAAYWAIRNYVEGLELVILSKSVQNGEVQQGTKPKDFFKTLPAEAAKLTGERA